MRILLIEDDETLCKTISFQLRQEGFSVDVSMDGEEGLHLTRQRLHDLILLDRMLPGLDGMEILHIMRREGIPTPVIFLTALGQLHDRTLGLNTGADDYIVKPFAFEELLARIRCVLRRPAVMQLSEKLSFGDIQYEPHTLTLSKDSSATVLSKRLGDLLELFLRNPGQTLPRETILLRVWGMDSDVEDGNLDNYTYFLGRSLRKVGSQVQLATVRGWDTDWRMAMFNKLRWKLTAFNTAITGMILLCMIFLCLTLLEKNTKDQTLRNFTDTAQAVCTYLEVQNQISDTWLRQMEADPNIHISVIDAGKPLFSMSLSPGKAQLAPVFQQARDLAGDRTGSQIFSMEGYYAEVCQIEKQDSALELILLYSLAEMEAGIQNQRIVVFFAAFLAILLLGIFSWFFTGKMLRPIQENQQRQTEFIAAASHELRTPLAAILSAASAMERAEPMQRTQFSDMIHREGNRMSRLIGDMLTLASSGSKNWQLQKESVELDMLLLEVYEIQYPLAKEKGLTLELSLYEQDIPIMKLDKDRITQVLSILLDNARNLTPAPGKIELELSLHKNKARISVSDTGPGVPDSEKQRIFERFYRGEKSRSSRSHFGLGLSIAAEIVKRHKGKIWVQDAPGGGAEFVVELPVN